MRAQKVVPNKSVLCEDLWDSSTIGRDVPTEKVPLLPLLFPPYSLPCLCSDGQGSQKGAKIFVALHRWMLALNFFFRGLANGAETWRSRWFPFH